MSSDPPSPVKSRTEATARLLAAIRSVPGLRPAYPMPRVGPTQRLPWDPAGLAVDLGDTVEVRLVATALPLPPLLDQAETACRTALADTPWARAALRLVITDLDAAALDTAAGP